MKKVKKIALTSFMILVATQVPTFAMLHTVEEIIKTKGLRSRTTISFPEDVARKAQRDKTISVTGFCLEKPEHVENAFSLKKPGYSRSDVFVNYATRFQDNRHFLTLELINNQFDTSNLQTFTVKCMWPPLYQTFDSINVSDKLRIGLEDLYSFAATLIAKRNRSKAYLYKEREPKIIVFDALGNVLRQKWDSLGRLDSERYRAKLEVQFSDLAQEESVGFLEKLSEIMLFPECLESTLLQSFKSNKLKNKQPLIQASQRSE